jgi:hypothetical protein
VALAKSDRTAVNELVKLLGNDGPFSRAINELMALMTPARWAYEDLITHADLEHATQQIDLKVDGISADLRFNTAELNTLALSFFLLCAKGVEANPFRSLVLDDPLQNMDEFTVTTVARGLGKLLAVWAEQDGSDAARWQVLLFLHAEEDIERMRNEIPCAVYYLPWLSPEPGASDSKNPPKVQKESSWMQGSLQNLDGVFSGG